VDLQKIEYLMVNSWKECLKTTLELTNMKHIKVTEETEEVSSFGRQFLHALQEYEGQDSEELDCLGYHEEALLERVTRGSTNDYPTIATLDLRIIVTFLAWYMK
jgi:hypothetical protein